MRITKGIRAYYNDNDPGVCAWLRELIKHEAITPGEVDQRPIQEVSASDLVGFQRVHVFAGIAGWDHALNLAEWGPREVWTGSCPCQPWSIAGKGLGEADPRDLWPVWFRLIDQCRPPTILGEQTAAKAGLRWLDRVYADVEGAGYTAGAADLCAAGARAPHLRQRLYFVADTGDARRQQDPRGTSRDEAADGGQRWHRGEPHRDHLPTGDGEGDHARLADPRSTQRGPDAKGRRDDADRANTRREEAAGGSELCRACDSRLADTHSGDSFWWSGPLQVGWNAIEAEIERGGRKYRAQWRVKPGVSLLAHGVPNRVAKLCGLGNAIVPQVAEAFIRAYLEC